MRTYLVLALVLVSSILAGCGGQISNLDAKDAGGQKIIYPITAEQADAVLAEAMLATFPNSQITNVSIPKKGYAVTLQVLIDTHDISALASPAAGRDSQGNTVNGYAFEVVHRGTLPHGPSRAGALFKAINERAAAIRTPVPAAS